MAMALRSVMCAGRTKRKRTNPKLASFGFTATSPAPENDVSEKEKVDIAFSKEAGKHDDDDELDEEKVDIASSEISEKEGKHDDDDEPGRDPGAQR